MKGLLIIILFILSVFSVHGKTDINKYLSIWNDPNASDSAKIQAIDIIAWNGYLYTQPDSSIFYAEQQLEFARKKGFTLEEALALNTIGSAYDLLGEFVQALDYYQQSLEVHKSLGNESGMAAELMNMATVYRELSAFPKSIDHFQKSMKIKNKLGDKKGVANILLGIGNVFSEMNDWSTAKEYFEKSLVIRKEIDDKKGIANSYTSLGNVSWKKESYRDALEFYQKAILLLKEIEGTRGLAVAYNNTAKVYEELGENARALEYYQLSLELRKKVSDHRGVASALSGIGFVQINLGAYQKSLTYGKEALQIASKLGAIKEIMEAYRLLYKSYKGLNQNDKALAMHEKVLIYRDSLINNEKLRETTNLKYQFKYDMKVMADSIKHQELKKLMDAKLDYERAENEKKEAEIQVKRNQQYALFGGLAIVIIFSLLLFNRFRITNKQKHIIEKQRDDVEKQKKITEKQKDLLEEKNKEVTDSINYAKRIQNAILPSKEVLNRWLSNGFILFKPKEIVSGDFYFIEAVKKKDKTLVYYAVVDCTGHGVPGAMVSIVAHNSLKKCINEFGLEDPAKILDHLSVLVIENFAQSDEKIRDGMDMSLLCIEYDPQGNTPQQLHFAGANNSLMIVHPNRKEWPEVSTPFKYGGGVEIKACRQPIGYSETKKQFKSHTINIVEGDIFYMASDGYADQFGGEHLSDKKAGGKKFKSSNLKKLLVNTSQLDMKDQHQLLNETFEKWRGDLEQIDDVCIMGIKI